MKAKLCYSTDKESATVNKCQLASDCLIPRKVYGQTGRQNREREREREREWGREREPIREIFRETHAAVTASEYLQTRHEHFSIQETWKRVELITCMSPKRCQSEQLSWFCDLIKRTKIITEVRQRGFYSYSSTGRWNFISFRVVVWGSFSGTPVCTPPPHFNSNGPFRQHFPISVAIIWANSQKETCSLLVCSQYR